MQMDFIPGCNFTNPRPVLPEDVAQCEGFGRPSWITKCVTLTNESGVVVARGICHCVNADLVIDSDGMPSLYGPNLRINRPIIDLTHRECTNILSHNALPKIQIGTS
jgi:hypothetical protein